MCIASAGAIRDMWVRTGMETLGVENDKGLILFHEVVFEADEDVRVNVSRYLFIKS